MKNFTILAAAFSTLIVGCATKGVTVSTPARHKQPAAEASVARGKVETWNAPVTVENLQGFDEEMFADLRRNVLVPLSKGPYRYAIDSITLAAMPGVEREWTLLVALDNGAAVRVEQFAQWDESKQSYFTGGLQRAMGGLKEASRKDEALGRYVAAVSTPRKVTRTDVLIAKTEAANRESD